MHTLLTILSYFGIVVIETFVIDTYIRSRLNNNRSFVYYLEVQQLSKRKFLKWDFNKKLGQKGYIISRTMRDLTEKDIPVSMIILEDDLETAIEMYNTRAAL